MMPLAVIIFRIFQNFISFHFLISKYKSVILIPKLDMSLK